ncbi:MAG: serine/threonine phosphatase, partial [Synechocystis sp.]|nr:serine/threonine phosphatase [Synechocystis sp.]
MLICPQCSAENPNRNNFCQKCGVSLVEHPCPHCGETVNYGDSHCSHCGGVVGRVLTVLIRQQADASGSEPAQRLDADHIELYENCIDIGQRYQLITPESGSPLKAIAAGDEELKGWLTGQAVDCQPLQPSVLKILLSQQTEFLQRLPQLGKADIVQDPAWLSLGLPDSVVPYFRFTDLMPAIPEVYDAWCEGASDWILLGDRQDWPRLVDLLSTETLPDLELIFWVKQIFQLWQRLAPQGFGQSLLIDHNLRIDEDQNIALTQLLEDDPDAAADLSPLGRGWHSHFSQTPAAPADLVTLLYRVAQGEYQAVEPILEELETLVVPLTSPPPDGEKVESLGNTEAAPQADPFTVHELNFDQIPDEIFELIETDESYVNDLDADPHNPSTMPDVNVFASQEVDDLPTAVLPMQLISLVDAGDTDRGGHRQHNEDFFGIATAVESHRNNHGKTIKAQGIYVVCDGMGGHAAGEVASQMAVKSLLEHFQPIMVSRFPNVTDIAEGIARANQQIYDINQSNASSGSGRMGTTLVMMTVKDTHVAIAHVGDSRIYRISRKGGLEQMTVDHEVGQQA